MLISGRDLDTMFKGSAITMGAKNLLSYHIQLLRDESPLAVKSKQKSSSSAPVYTGMAMENGELSLDDSDSDTYDRIDKQPKSKGVLPALHMQRQRLKDQMTKERQECLELEMNVESMLIEVKEPPPIGKSRLVCGYCYHHGHRNSGCHPCKMKKCTKYTYCGLKDKHPEYFSKLNSLKVELKKKKSALQEIEAQIKSMDDFNTGSEFSFVKNLTPRMFAADPSYKVNKAKLMRDVRLLRNFLDGKIPAVTANDNEQLRILISKCKRNVGIPPDTDVDAWAENTASGCDISPTKNQYKDKVFQTEIECFDQRRQPSKKPRKHKKQTKAKKVKKRRRECSSSSSEDDMRPQYSRNVNPGTFPYFNPISNAGCNLPNMSYPNFYLPPARYDPLFNPGPGPSYNLAKCGNVVSSLVNNPQQISNTNLFEEPAPFGSPNVRVTTTLTPPKSTESKMHEQVSWNNLDALAAGVEQGMQ